jgi:hypothetical protein
MDEEMTTLNANVIWELMTLPKDKKIIRCKSLYKIKHNVIDI